MAPLREEFPSGEKADKNAQHPMVGGYSAIAVTYKEVIDAAAFAVDPVPEPGPKTALIPVSR